MKKALLISGIGGAGIVAAGVGTGIASLSSSTGKKNQLKLLKNQLEKLILIIQEMFLLLQKIKTFQI